MNEIFRYIRNYVVSLNPIVFLLCSIQTALLVFLNFHNGLEQKLTQLKTLPWPGFTGHYLFFFPAFALPYLYETLIGKKTFFRNKTFILLLFIAPAIFSLKMSMHTDLDFSADPLWNRYWNQVYYWPVRLLIVGSFLLLVWWWFDRDQPFYGLSVRNSILKKSSFNWKPYILMLLIMMPLIAAASTQHDFLRTYPKLYSVLPGRHQDFSFFKKLLFEFSYGTDFITIEVFFRGFLILAFLKWVGKDAILPMACFYCTIHFGKPLGECISSYFGGILLGIVVYNTRTIYGGLMVHLGIAWMMEFGGYLGRWG
jgi:hypothetical protein